MLDDHLSQQCVTPIIIIIIIVIIFILRRKFRSTDCSTQYDAILYDAIQSEGCQKKKHNDH